MISIAKEKAHLNDFYKANTMEDKSIVVDNYAREKLDIDANIDIKDNNRDYFPIHTESPLTKRFFYKIPTMNVFVLKTLVAYSNFFFLDQGSVP